MKTKKIEIQRWIVYQSDDMPMYFYCGHEEKPSGAVPCRIAFEVLMPEPTASITPSQIDLEYQKWDRTLNFPTYLKSKLFPGWSE
jgi:hypothetical protein